MKKRLRATVRRTIEKSPESFITYLIGHIKKHATRPSGIDQVAKGKLNLVCLIVGITLDDLLVMYESQGGCCAVSHLPMTHKLNDLCAISIDRIDSSLGYVSGNVHLVCQWVNAAKRHFPLEDLLAVLERSHKRWAVREGLLFSDLSEDELTTALAKSIQQELENSHA